MSLAPIKMISAPRLSVSMGPLGAQGPLHLGETEARKRRGLVEDLLAPPALRQGQLGRGGGSRLGARVWGTAPVCVDAQLAHQAITPSGPC